MTGARVVFYWVPCDKCIFYESCFSLQSREIAEEAEYKIKACVVASYLQSIINLPLIYVEFGKDEDFELVPRRGELVASPKEEPSRFELRFVIEIQSPILYVVGVENYFVEVNISKSFDWLSNCLKERVNLEHFVKKILKEYGAKEIMQMHPRNIVGLVSEFRKTVGEILEDSDSHEND